MFERIIESRGPLKAVQTESGKFVIINRVYVLRYGPYKSQSAVVTRLRALSSRQISRESELCRELDE